MRETDSQHHTQWAKTKNFPTKIRKKTRMSIFTTSIQHSIGSPSHRNQTTKRNKGIQNRKEKAKLSLFADDIAVYIENPIDSTKKLLDLINEFGITADTKSISRNQRHFCTPTIIHQKQKSGKTNPIWYSNKKNNVPRSKPNQGGKRPVLTKLHNTELHNPFAAISVRSLPNTQLWGSGNMLKNLLLVIVFLVLSSGQYSRHVCAKGFFFFTIIVGDFILFYFLIFYCYSITVAKGF